MTLSRRSFLKQTGATALISVLGSGCSTLRGTGQTGTLLRSDIPLPDPFGVPLPVPVTAQPTDSAGGVDRYRIVQRKAALEILPGHRTTVSGYDGMFPGPTIESRSGRPVSVQHINELDVPTVVHLHGAHVSDEHDGFPTDLVLPRGMDRAPGHHPTRNVYRGSFTYEYPMSQRAATLWYHDHRMDFTGPAVYHGLAGFHLVRDADEERLSLPSGEREIPLMIADRSFSADGSFKYPALDPTMLHQPGVEEAFMPGVLGDVVLVNGAPWPELEVLAAKYRFRILNASNARRYELRLESEAGDAAPIIQIGSDGGLLDSPVRHDTLQIAPAERFDVVIDFAQFAPDSVVTMSNALGENRTRDVMRFRVTAATRDDAEVPGTLSRIPVLDPGDAPLIRQFSFTQGPLPDGKEGWLINGQPYDPERIDARPALDRTEVWRFVSDVHHPIHAHLAHFQVLRRGGGGPGSYDRGWKDTVDLRPGEVVEVAIRFTGFAGTYLLHCHNLEHEDMMMMSNFETTG